MSRKKNNNQTNIQELILRGYKSPTQEDIHDGLSCVPRTLTKYPKLHEEEASMNQYMLQLKCLLKNLTMLEEGMVYVGNMKPIVFEPIYVLAQMQAKLYKFRNRLGNLPKEHRKYAHNLIGNVYGSIIDQCVQGAQAEDCLKKIVTDVAYIDDIMKYNENNVQNSIIPYQMNIRPWLGKNNMRHTSKLPLKKIDPNDCKLNLMKKEKLPKCKTKKSIRESVFLEKIKEVTKQEKKRLYNTADKKISACIETDNVAMQFDPKLSGPMTVPECFGELENKIRSPWLANTKTSSYRTSIEEQLPAENNFHYVLMRHATTNVLSTKNTKETQTRIFGIPPGNYEYTVIDMKYTKERIVNNKTEQEMINNLNSRQVSFLSEKDIFETMPTVKQEDSYSSSGTVIEDSDCNIKISNVETKPCYKKYKMLYSTNKNITNTSSNKDKSVLIDKDTIEHKDEILAYIKELGTILVNSYKIERSEDSETDNSLITR